MVIKPTKSFQTHKNEDIKFSTEKLVEIKKVATGHLRFGFKSLNCLRDYYKLKLSAFVFPSKRREWEVLALSLLSKGPC